MAERRFFFLNRFSKLFFPIANKYEERNFISGTIDFIFAYTSRARDNKMLRIKTFIKTCLRPIL